MAIKIINDVFDNSEMRGNDRLVMIAIADNADNEKRQAWPSVKEIGRKTRIPVRTVWRCIKRCVSSGELRIVKSGTKQGESNLYEVLVKRSSPQPTDKMTDVPVSGTPPMPSIGIPPMPPSGTLTVIEPSIEPSIKGEAKAWGSLCPCLESSPKCKELWNQWMEHRRKLKKPSSDWDKFFARQAQWLNQFDSMTIMEILEKSIINNYQGLFPPNRSAKRLSGDNAASAIQKILGL